MNIAFIGDFTKKWNEEGIALALESLGHTVYRLQEDDRYHPANTPLFEKVKNMPACDIVLLAKLKTVVQREEILRQINKHKVVVWNFDLYIGLNRQRLLREDPIFKLGLFLSPDGGHDEQFKELGVNHSLLRQGIHSEYCYKGEQDERYAYDVVFVGCRNREWQYRNALIDRLSYEYPKFRHVGMKGSEEMRGDELNKLYANAKVVVGDSVYSPRYWSNRIYETLGRGGFLIHPYIEGLDEEYEAHVHYVPYTYGELDELKDKINYYLAHDDERMKISAAAMEHTKNNHTLEHRCKRLIELCTSDM